MSKTYEEKSQESIGSDIFIKSIMSEFLNYIAEKEDYSEVKNFVDKICESTEFFCPYFEESANILVFTPRINNQMLTKLGIEPLDYCSFEFQYDENGNLTKKYVFSLKSNTNLLLGEDLKLTVTFSYGLLKIKNIPVTKKTKIDIMMFPILYPYQYHITSLESDYRKYYPSKKISGSTRLAGEVIPEIKKIEFQTKVLTPSEITAISKMDNKPCDEIEDFDEKDAICMSSKKRVCYPHRIEIALCYAGNVMGKFEETTVRTLLSKYETKDKRVKVLNYISSLSKGNNITLDLIEYPEKEEVSYETSILPELFTLEEVKKEEGGLEKITEKILEMITSCIKLEKQYVSASKDSFGYYETFDEKKLAKCGVRLKHLKSFKYPFFHVKDNIICVCEHDEKRIVDFYQVTYKKREFYFFVVKKMKKLCTYLNAVSMQSFDLQTGYVDIVSALIFEISFRNEERYIREEFVEGKINEWERLKKDAEVGISKNKRIERLLATKRRKLENIRLFKEEL